MFRVAKEGQTIDGRFIKREWLTDIASTYNPAVYSARIFVEHERGWSPESPFFCGGDVTAVKASDDDDGKMVLYAAIEPNDKFKNMNKADQKVFPSIEVVENFAGTGKAYLGGLGATDSPASLGTEKFKFSANSAFGKGIFGKGALYLGEEISLADMFATQDTEDGAGKKDETETKAVAGLESIFTKAFNKLFGKFTEQGGDTEAERQSGEKATAPSISFDKAQLDSAALEFAQAVTEHFTTNKFALAKDLHALSQKLDQAMTEPQPHHSARPPATGGNDGDTNHKADY